MRANGRGQGRMRDTSDDSFERGLELQRARRFAEAAEVYRRLAQKVLTVNLAINLGACLTEIGDRAGPSTTWN